MTDATTDTTTSTETSTASTDADSGTTATASTTETNDGADADSSTVLGSATTDDGAGDGKSDGDKAEADDKGDDDGAAGVPEAYDLNVTVKDAEGKETQVEIDSELLTEATPVLKELGLTNEQANKLAPFIVKAQERAFQRQTDDFATIKADWAKEAEADPEIGGKNWKTTQANAAKAIDRFIGPVTVKDKDGKDVPNPARQLLNESGLGNHKDLIRAWAEVGSMLAEDGTMARSDASQIAKKSREEALYPDDVPKK